VSFSADNRIRDTLNNLILRSPSDWQTTAALPFAKVEGVTVEWDEMHFDVRLLQRVPYEGALPPPSATRLAFAYTASASAQVSRACRLRFAGATGTASSAAASAW